MAWIVPTEQRLTDLSDHTLSPEKQAEQIMAIYPIVKGQKPDQRHVIPPHSPAARPIKAHETKPAENHIDDNLIDFADTPAPAPVPAPAPAPVPAKPASAEPATKQSEIQSLLAATGKVAPPNEPLIDFTNDLKKDLPPTTQQ